MTMDQELLQEAANSLIAYGAPAFHGQEKPIEHAPPSYYMLYATPNSGASDTDKADVRGLMTHLMTFQMYDADTAEPQAPWDTLEQPSCSFMFGKRPGTITLNHWVSMQSHMPESIGLRDSGVQPRPMSLEQILERMKELQAGLEDDDEPLLYKILYRRILKDPDRVLSPHKTLDKQITDLIMVLSRSDWIDLTDLKNQVVTRYLFDPDQENLTMYHKFLHQILLSIELEQRIHSQKHDDWAKDRLLSQIPPTMRWNLALARRWKEFIRIDSYGPELDQSMSMLSAAHAGCCANVCEQSSCATS